MHFAAEVSKSEGKIKKSFFGKKVDKISRFIREGWSVYRSICIFKIIYLLYLIACFLMFLVIGMHILNRRLSRGIGQN